MFNNYGHSLLREILSVRMFDRKSSTNDIGDRPY